MKAYSNSSKANKSDSAIKDVIQYHTVRKPSTHFKDNRPETVQLKHLQDDVQKSENYLLGRNVAQLMKKSTQIYGLDKMASAESAETRLFSSGLKMKKIRYGLLKTTLNSDLQEEQKRHNVLEILLEDIGGNSKGHHLITGDEDLLSIFKQVCGKLGITVAWTNLNTEK